VIPYKLSDKNSQGQTKKIVEKKSFSENEVLTSTTIKNDNAVKTGKMYKASGVERSVNQKAPPCLNDGIFSAMLDICHQRK
jgi:hypothetical protein